MGDRYYTKIKCPYCKKLQDVYYAPTAGFTRHTCDDCKKESRIVMDFTLEKNKDLQST